MKVSDFEDLSDQTLFFAFNESSKLLDSTLTSFRETINKSYVALGVYTSILAYYFEKSEGKPSYLIIVVASIVSIIILWRNLLPSRMSFNGTLPVDIIHPFYRGKNNQLREIHISKLIAHEQGIARNISEIAKRNNRFKTSALVLIIAFILTCLCSLPWIGQCLPIWIR